MPVLHSPSHLFVADKKNINCPRIMLAIVIYIIILVIFFKSLDYSGFCYNDYCIWLWVLYIYICRIS